jgi:hypothetical protein
MSQTRETDGLSTATKPKTHIIKSDSRSADAFGQVDLAVNNAHLKSGAAYAGTQGPPRGGLCSGDAGVCCRAAGLLVTTLAARAADEPARPRPTVERGGTDSVRVQPTEKSFAPPNQPASAPATRATSTSAIASSSVYRRRPRRRACVGNWDSGAEGLQDKKRHHKECFGGGLD